MADSARAVGFERVETVPWGERRPLSATVELEVVPEHVAPDGMRTNNYALESARARVFYGGEVLDVARVERYARTSDPFDVAIGPVNGVRFQGRQLVATALEMAAVARALGAPTLIPIHDGHLPYEGLVEVTSSGLDLEAVDPADLTVVTLDSGERYVAPA